MGPHSGPFDRIYWSETPPIGGEITPPNGGLPPPCPNTMLQFGPLFGDQIVVNHTVITSDSLVDYYGLLV